MPAVWVPDTPRTFNLGLRRRDVDHKAKTVTLDLASDEALLMDYATLVRDLGAWAHQGSLRAVCDYVLGKIGASLAAGPDDADVTAMWTVTNMIPNPSGELTVNGWGLGTGASALAVVTPPVAAPLGTKAVRWTAAAGSSAVRAGGWDGVSTTKVAKVTPGRLYTASIRLLSQVARPATLILAFRDENGTSVAGAYSATVNTSSSAWTELKVTGTVPSTAGYAYLAVTTTGNSAGQFHYGDAVMLVEGEDAPVPFSGDTADTTDYLFEWADAAHDSPSTRTALSPRPPETLHWEPGVTAWDFLAPLCTSAGLRLFCDELRVWRLIDPGTYEVPGYVPISPLNATEGVDTVGRDDPEVFATGVVCRYVWTDVDGIARTATDSAGAPEKVAVIDYARPYPGPGAAAAVLARRNGLGRTQVVAGLARWSATPGMVASISLPSAATQLGKVSVVEWALDDSGLMRLDARGLIDVYPGSIDSLVGMIDELVGTIDAL